MAAFHPDRSLVGNLFGANQAAYRLVTSNGSHGQARDGHLVVGERRVLCGDTS